LISNRPQSIGGIPSTQDDVTEKGRKCGWRKAYLRVEDRLIEWKPLDA